MSQRVNQISITGMSFVSLTHFGFSECIDSNSKGYFTLK